MKTLTITARDINGKVNAIDLTIEFLSYKKYGFVEQLKDGLGKIDRIVMYGAMGTYVATERDYPIIFDKAIDEEVVAPDKDSYITSHKKTMNRSGYRGSDGSDGLVATMMASIV
jgi:hypothetical protein